MGIVAARLAVYEALRRVTAGEIDLSQALARTRAALADERDRALAADILTGTERWRGAIDFLIQRYAGRSLSRLDAEVVEVLRLSAYQILHLDRVPAAAVVDDAVELARRAGKTSAAGFVNAVLRAFCRDRMHPPLPAPPGPPDPSDGPGRRQAELDYLAIALSHPRWLASRWLDRHGFDAAASWMAFNNQPARLTVRANRLRTSRSGLAAAFEAHGVSAAPTRFAPDGLVVTEGNPLKTPLAASGLFFVQDEASQLISYVAAARPGTRVLDCCAAPGGKTVAMAADMEDRGVLVASDVRRPRVALLRQTVLESGATCIRLLRADMRRALPCRPAFDLVVVDAPCSGLGTLRRDPDLRWRRSEGDVADFAAAERQLLAAAAGAVRAGGRLVYATCSSEPEENERVIEEFLAGQPAFRPLDLRDGIQPVADHLRELFTRDGHLRTYPHQHALEAFFAAAVQRVLA